MDIDTATAEKILRNAGADGVENDAAEEFAELLEVFAGHISEEAVGLVEDAQRKVVTKEDVQHALE